MVFSGHLPKKNACCQNKRECVVCSIYGHTTKQLEIRPLLANSLSHLILSMSVNVTFTYRKGSNPCVSLYCCHPLPTSSHWGFNHSHSFYYLYTDDSHTWVQHGRTSHSAWCLHNLLVMGGVGAKKERPSCWNQWWPPKESLYYTLCLYLFENFHYKEIF